MTWLFERTIEVAAWVAMIMAWVLAALSVIWLVQWFGTLQGARNDALLVSSAWAATACVGFSVALGVLACIDRFIFDADEKAA